MVCFQCGEELEENAKFCSSCGTPLEAELSVPTSSLAIPQKQQLPKGADSTEQDLWTCRYSPLNLFDSFVVTLAIIVAVLILHANLVSSLCEGKPVNLDFGFRNKKDWMDTLITGVNYIFYGFIIIFGTIYLLKCTGKLFGRKYHVTTERVLIRRGLIVPHLYEIELDRIDDLIVKQGFIGRFIVDTGDVLIVASDSPVGHPLFEGIRHPVYVKELIRVEMKKSRGK
jgi:hypothetical protein